MSVDRFQGTGHWGAKVPYTCKMKLEQRPECFRLVAAVPVLRQGSMVHWRFPSRGPRFHEQPSWESGIERKTTVCTCSGIRQNSKHLQDFWRNPLRQLLAARCKL